MSLTQTAAEALGWVFHGALEGDPGASKRLGNDLVQKSHPTLDALLGDIEAWENHHVRAAGAPELDLGAQEPATEEPAADVAPAEEPAA